MMLHGDNILMCCNLLSAISTVYQSIRWCSDFNSYPPWSFSTNVEWEMKGHKEKRERERGERFNFLFTILIF